MYIALLTHAHVHQSDANVFFETFRKQDNYRKVYGYDLINKILIDTNCNYPRLNAYFKSTRQCISYLKTHYVLKKTNKMHVIYKQLSLWQGQYYDGMRTKYHYEIVDVKDETKNPLGFKK